MNIQETLSNALEKSSLRNTEGCLDVLAQYKIFWIKILLSRINLRDKNAICSGLITSRRMD